ncbi:MAG: undecaprenyl-diphosphate phosphatase [Thermoguttaceae bacterium]|jgi:undecaprenyl-diphosphatase|nr:undecaprenyl-diphosphate phosphatase [Thermoguttaceae bacterium]
MLWLQVLILAVVQGITEFLPVSSSGHVIVGASLFDQIGDAMTEKLTLNIVLHVGTLASIVVFFRDRIIALLGRDRRVIGLLVVGTLPAVGIGLLLKASPLGPGMESILESPLVAGAMFPVTGAMLLWAMRHEDGRLACREIGYGQALVIGLFQAFAVLPGISRSGSTIVASLGCGLRRDEAATFSFLLAIPALAGGGLLEVISMLRKGPGDTPGSMLLMGGLVSFLVGLFALWWLLRWIRQGRLGLFAWYLIPLGAAVLLWQLAG